MRIQNALLFCRKFLGQFNKLHKFGVYKCDSLRIAVVFLMCFSFKVRIYTAACEVRDKATGEDGEGAEGEREKVWLTRNNLLVVLSSYE